MKCKIRKSWLDAEMEHTNSRKVARRIVSDHIREHGCSYYPALLKMETKLKKGGNKR